MIDQNWQPPCALTHRVSSAQTGRARQANSPCRDVWPFISMKDKNLLSGHKIAGQALLEGGAAGVKHLILWRGAAICVTRSAPDRDRPLLKSASEKPEPRPLPPH